MGSRSGLGGALRRAALPTATEGNYCSINSISIKRQNITVLIEGRSNPPLERTNSHDFGQPIRPPHRVDSNAIMRISLIAPPHFDLTRSNSWGYIILGIVYVLIVMLIQDR